MSSLAFLLLSLAGDAVPAAPAVPKPEVALFARAFVVGYEITDGFGLESEIGAKTSLADIVHATLLFEHQGIQKRTFPTISVAPQQIRAAVDARASLVVALDYLTPFVYVEAGSDDQRRSNVEAALKVLETLNVPMILGNVPDLTAASTVLNGLVTPKMLPRPDALAAINTRILEWAATRRDVVVAPLQALFAHIDSGEGFGVRDSTWPPSWLPELVQKDRFHPRMHGTIAAWLLGLDALCKARKDLDPLSFDWSAASIYKKVYAAKEAERKAAVQREVDARRLLPNRPPPGPPPPRPPPLDPLEEQRQKGRGDTPRGDVPETDKQKKQKDKDKDEGG
ncbi:MAG: hypothetical protein SGI72_02710 [Planctomycetota bacterium]|nr:hypothetical protein [Planctomycetota bacterium]